MKYGTSTQAQRLAWQYSDETAGVHDDPSLDELFEVEDDAFRHWDTMTFAHTPPLTGRWDKGTRERPAATSSSAGGGPTNCEARPAALPPATAGLASPSIERWMWTA